MKVFTAILFRLKYWKISIHLRAHPGRPGQLMKILIELLFAGKVEALSRLLLVVMKGKVKSVLADIFE